MNNELNITQTEECDSESKTQNVSSALAGETLEVVINLLEELQKIVSSGNPKCLKVKFGDKVIAELPLALTAVGALAAGVGAVLLTKLTVEIERED